MIYRSYAKINLYLDVLSKRDDGYHSIETIFQSISLFDTLQCEFGNEISLTVEGADLPTNHDNLVVRAAQLMQKHFHQSRGAKLTLKKSIPVAAGLAGGSGNAAATLVCLNKLWGIDAPTKTLLELASKLGSDVPFCLVGGTVAGTGRGEILTPLTALPERWFVLVHPPIQVSTPEIYNHPKLKKSEYKIPVTGRSTALDLAIRRCLDGDVSGALYNAMEGVALMFYPQIEAIQTRLTGAGCKGVLMSGSGPTVFGLCDQAQARSIQSKLGDLRTSVVHTVSQAVEAV